jgi:membrane protease YdiL (CAAX protease family)
LYRLYSGWVIVKTLLVEDMNLERTRNNHQSVVAAALLFIAALPTVLIVRFFLPKIGYAPAMFVGYAYMALATATWWVGFGKPELSLAHPTRHQVLIGLLWGTIQQLVIIPIQLFQSSQASSTSSPSTNDPLAGGVISIGLVLLSVTYPVFVEEGVFRGFLLNSLRPFLPQWGSIGINGILFAIWHLNSYKLPTTLIGGFLCTWLALRYGFWSAVIAHAWLNSSGVVLMLLGRWLGII